MLIILYIGIPIFLDSTLIHLHLKAIISLQPLLYKNGNEHLNKDTIIGLINYNYKQGLNKNFQKIGGDGSLTTRPSIPPYVFQRLRLGFFLATCL